jgi:hypothetical protein
MLRSALGSLTLMLLLCSSFVVTLKLLATRWSVTHFMAVPALLGQKGGTDHNPIGSGLGLHPMAGVFHFRLAGIVTYLAIGLWGSLLHILVVAVCVHSKNLIVKVMCNLHPLKSMKIISIFFGAA